MHTHYNAPTLRRRCHARPCGVAHPCSGHHRCPARPTYHARRPSAMHPAQQNGSASTTVPAGRSCIEYTPLGMIRSQWPSGPTQISSAVAHSWLGMKSSSCVSRLAVAAAGGDGGFGGLLDFVDRYTLSSHLSPPGRGTKCHEYPFPLAPRRHRIYDRPGDERERNHYGQCVSVHACYPPVPA
jgi:hypothetical protein